VDRERIMANNRANIAEFRASGGRIATFGDAPLLLLTTTGAQSGQPRTSPMMYLADEDDPNRVYVFASYAGADVNPAWFHNLVVHPDAVRVEIGREAPKCWPNRNAPRCSPSRPGAIRGSPTIKPGPSDASPSSHSSCIADRGGAS